MKLPLRLHPGVYKDVDDAWLWYEQQRAGLGNRFLAAIEQVFNRVQRVPLMHEVVYKDVRLALARRFPYGVYFRVQPDRIDVIAVDHNRRNPEGWQARA